MKSEEFSAAFDEKDFALFGPGAGHRPAAAHTHVVGVECCHASERGAQHALQ